MRTKREIVRAAQVAVLIVMLLAPAGVIAQDVGSERVVPTYNALVSGYGTVGYIYRTQGGNENEFTAAISPIFLFQFQDRILFELELEFELEEGVTETGVEYAQVDFLAHDNLTLTGGRFLLPFGVFGERLHPTWINKFPTAPPIYGHHVTEFGVEPLLPILADVGIMARGTYAPGALNAGFSLYVTQGPSQQEGEEEIPELEFPASSGDTNENKMLGGRLDLVLPPWAEVNISAVNGDYDDQGVLDFTGWNVAVESRWSGLELRGEYIQTRQEIEVPTGFPTFKRHGFYAQASYRWRNWEPVFRWTQVFDSKLDGARIEEGAWQAGFGLDYWFSPSIALMAGFELNKEDGMELENDRFVAHFAYGF